MSARAAQRREAQHQAERDAILAATELHYGADAAAAQRAKWAELDGHPLDGIGLGAPEAAAIAKTWPR